MSKLSYKSLLIIFCFLLISVIVLAKFVLPKNTASATWWNDSWHYRQAINISSHNTNESNVFIITSISIGSTTKAQLDDGDFRFINQTGNILPYYISSGTGTTAITFHIQLSSFPSGAQTIYAYYGNSTVENGFSASDFSTEASNYTIGSLSSEEAGGGPIAYWKFDEGVGTTTYDSAGSNTGTITGGTWQTEENCVSGKCLSFDGTSGNITAGTNPSLNISDQMTSELWVYWYSHKNYGSFFGKSVSGSVTNSNYMWFGYNNRITFWIADGVGYDVATVNVSSGYINTNQWHHLIGRVTNDKVEIWVDGVMRSQVNRTKNPKSNTDAIELVDPLYVPNAKFDEMKLYPYARTAAQIKLDYNSRGTLSGSSANLGVQSNTTPSLKSSLIAYYKFNEGVGTTTYDSSPQKKSGSFIGTTLPTWSKNCQQGNCINFISTNANKISTNTSYNNSSEYTISAFIYPTTAGGNQYRIILGSSMGNNIDSGLVLPPGGGLNICYHNYMGSGDANYCSTNNPITLNKWQYVALTFKDNNVNVYHNGINVRNVSIGKTSSSNYTLIGGANSDSYGGDRFFNGLIDEVKIYNAALSADEIKQDFNAGSVAKFGSTSQTIGGTTTSLDYCIPGDTSYCAAPVAEWNFEENTGTTINDTSGNNNNGTFHGSPTWSVGQNNKGSGIRLNSVGNYIETNSLGTTLSSNYTVEGWVKIDEFSTDGDSNRAGLIGGVACNSSNSIEFNIGGGTATDLPKIGIGRGCDWSSRYSTGTFEFKKWTHISLVVESIGSTKTAIFYIDGKNSGTQNVSAYNTDIKGQLALGDNAFRRTIGTIDNIKIYDYVRTPAQIAYDYNKGAPVAWWKFDECQGNVANDSSGLGNTGAISIGQSGSQNSLGTCQIGTSAAWTNGASGHLNSSLNFDGTDDVVYIPDSNNSLDMVDSFSLVSWIKPKISAVKEIIYKGTGGSSNYELYQNGLNVSCVLGNYLSSTTTSNNPISLNTWNHLICTYDKNSSLVKIYFNGNLIKTGSYSSSLSVDNNHVGIGGNSSGYYFQGQIDDVRIYNYALTSKQVKQIYNGGAVNFQ